MHSKITIIHKIYFKVVEFNLPHYLIILSTIQCHLFVSAEDANIILI